MRRALTALYVGLIGSSENARSLLDNDVDAIKPEMAQGNQVTTYCFRLSMRWLRYLKEFSVSQKTFSEQFLEPARAVARFILTAREREPYSMTLNGFIFLKSPPFYDKAFRENMCTLAILIPELKSVLSIRCRKQQADSITVGEYRIHGIQPVPFVNRAHPTKLEIEPLNNTIDPFELSFCKMSFKDLDSIDRLLAFENLSELWSEQIYDINSTLQGRRLGFVAILGGKVLSTGSGPYIVMQDPCGSQAFYKFFVNQRVLKSLNLDLVELEGINGKLIKVMVIFWYRYGSIRFTPQYPEIISLRFVNDKTSLIKDDLIGFVRLRDKIDLRLLGDRYTEINPSSPPKPLTATSTQLIYDFSTLTENRIARIFLEQKALIKSLREKMIFEVDKNQERSYFVLPKQVLNEKRLKLKGMAEWIYDNKPLLHCLLALLMKCDLNGELPTNYKEFVTKYPKFGSFFSLESFLWLKNLDLIYIKKENPIQVSKRGVDVAYLALEELVTNQLEKVISKINFVDFVGLETKIPVPPTILLKSLRELERKRVATPSVVDGVKCELFWFRYGKEVTDRINDEMSHKLMFLEEQVMYILNSVHHPLHAIAVLERIRERGQNLSYPALSMVLWRLADKKRIENKLDFWFYPLKTRVVNVLEEKPFEAFTTEEIAIKVSYAPMLSHLIEVNKILKELELEGVAQEVIDGQWSLPLHNNGDRRQRILENACRKKVLILLERSPVKEEELLYNIVSFVLSTKKRIQISESSLQIASEVIRKMLEIGEIIRSGNFIKIK